MLDASDYPQTFWAADPANRFGDAAPFFPDRADQRIANASHHRRNLPLSRIFQVRDGLKAFASRFPEETTFDVSQGDGGATLNSIRREELTQVLHRFLPSDRVTAYGSPLGDQRVRKLICENYYRFDRASGLTPENIILTDGGRDALQKWYQAVQLLSGNTGECLLTSAAPWTSYGHGAYISGFNLLCAPVTNRSFKITPEGIDQSIRLAEVCSKRMSALLITSPDNPTGSYYSHQELLELLEHAASRGIKHVFLDLMYQTILDSGLCRYDMNALVQALTPQARRALTFMDGLTKSIGASNVRAAHMVCCDIDLWMCVAALSSHTVLPNVLGTALSYELYGWEKPDHHPWVQRIAGPTAVSRDILRRHLSASGYLFFADQGYYAFVFVGGFIGRELPKSQRFTDLNGEEITRIGSVRDLTSYLAIKHGIAVVPGDVFHQPHFIRFSVANPPSYTAHAFERFHSALKALS